MKRRKTNCSKRKVNRKSRIDEHFYNKSLEIAKKSEMENRNLKREVREIENKSPMLNKIKLKRKKFFKKYWAEAKQASALEKIRSESDFPHPFTSMGCYGSGKSNK